MRPPGPLEIGLILLIILIVFGVGKLPQVGTALGKGISGFRKAAKGDDEEEPEKETKKTAKVDEEEEPEKATKKTAKRKPKKTVKKAVSAESDEPEKETKTADTAKATKSETV